MPDIPARDPRLAALDAHYRSMPPVAALQVAIAGYADGTLRLVAPLEANVNDKGCAFGGSLASLMTLAGWGLVTLQVEDAGLHADVFVADSQVRYRAPVFEALDVTASRDPDEAQDWAGFIAMLGERGRARIGIRAQARLGDGSVASDCIARFVAIARPASAHGEARR